MIGNSFLDYIKIQAGITALRLTTPASCLYLIIGAVNTQLLYWPLVAYCTSEVLFYTFIYLPRTRKFQQPPAYVPPNLTREQRLRIVRHCIGTTSYTATPGSPYPSCWFLPHNHGSPASRADVQDWLAWALFSIDGKFMSPEIREEIDEYTRLLEEESGVTFPDQYYDAKELRGIRVSLDPVLATHRPLVWYMIVAAVDTYTSIRLRLLGFKHYTPSDAGYATYFPPRPILHLLSRRAPPGIKVPFWYRPHRSTTKHPLIFIHGIGIGLFPYIPFFTSVTQGDDKDVGVILPELLPISMHMTQHTVPPRPDILRTLKLIVEYVQSDASSASGSPFAPNGREQASLSLLNASGAENKAGWDSIVFAGHSYGTFIAGWLIREYVDYLLASESNTSALSPNNGPPHPPVDLFADRISHFVLVDPIPILLSNPSVAYNFLYRDPHTVCPKCHNTICNAVGSRPDSWSNLNSNRPSAGQTPPAHRPPSLNTQATYTSMQSRSPSIPSNMNTPHPFPLTPKCKGAWYSAPSAWQLWYFASRDADVARTLFRSFFWAEGGVWRDDLTMLLKSGWERPLAREGQTSRASHKSAVGNGTYGSVSPPSATSSGHLSSSKAVQPGTTITTRKYRKIAVVLAGLDQIIPAEAVRHHLTQTDEWVDRWTGKVDQEGEVRGVEDWESGFTGLGDGDADVRIRVDRVPLDQGTLVGGDEHEFFGEVESGELDKGMLEVLYNPKLDHASIFDSEADSVPLVEVVRRYIRDI